MTPAPLEDLRARLAAATGLRLDPDDLRRAVRTRLLARAGAAAAAVDTDPEADAAAAAYAAAAAADPAEFDALVDQLVVPESWLFRDPVAFTAAVQEIAARLAAGRAPVRVLSVPCAAGEEPYSLAMALADAGVPAAAVTIDAVDLSAACLARARAGLYTRNAFRNPDPQPRARYFTRTDGGWQLAAALRAQVRFSQGNVLTLAAEQPYDIVFCRNLLIYFDAATAARAVGRLRALLAADGVLFAGYAEVPLFARHGFAPTGAAGAFALHQGPPPPPPARPPGAGERRHPSAPARAAPAPRPPPPERRHAHTPRRQSDAPAAPPAAPAARLAAAQALADQGDLAAAARLCTELVAAQPDCAAAWFLLGLHALRAGRTPEAVDALRRCTYLQPDHYDALCQLALLAERGGDPAAAARLRQRAARVHARREAP
ncbi:MAG: CheR family methyltransferase [Telluria sp.]